MVLHLVAVAVAAIFLNLGLVVQSKYARSTDAEKRLRPGLLVELARSRGWLLATGATAAGALLEVYAYRELPVALVQPSIAGGIIIVPLASHRMTGERPSMEDALLIGLILAAVISLGRLTPAGAQPDHLNLARLLVAAVTAIGVLLACGLLPRSELPLTTAAGAAFGLTGVAAKALAISSFPGQTFLIVGVLFVGFGIVGLAAEMSALQAGSPSRVAASVLGLTTIVPVVSAPWLFGEHWPHPLLTAACVLVTVGAAGRIATGHRREGLA